MTGANQTLSLALRELRQEMTIIAEIAGCVFACVRHREGDDAGFDGVEPKVNQDAQRLLIELAKEAQESGLLLQQGAALAAPFDRSHSLVWWIEKPELDAQRFKILVESQITRVHHLQRHHLLLQAMSDGALLLDEKWHVLACSEQIARLLGVPPEQVEGQPSQVFFPSLPQELERLEAISGYLELAQGTFEFTLHHALTSPAACPHYLLKIRTLSRQRQMDSRQTERLAILRHDLRSPLAAIKGLISVFEEEPDLSLEERSHLFELLRQETDRTLAWADDFITVLHLKMTPPQPPFPNLTLRQAIQQMTEPFIAHAHSRQVELHFHLSTDHADYQLQAEPQLFEAFARNCVGHFLRLADRGASLSLTLTPEGFKLRGEGAGLFAQPVREPFSALPRTTASGKRTPGVGLSLILAKRVADLHGWHMKAQNERGSDGILGLELLLTWPTKAPVALV